MKTSISLNLAFAGMLLCCLSGCGGGDLGRVTGTVHLDGKPLEGALVSFFPQVSGDATGSQAGTSLGRTDAEGKYELIYTRDAKGALIGKHLVQIETLEEGGGYGGGRKEEVPKRYNSASELNVQVTSGNNTIDFLDLTSDGEKNEARGGGAY